MGVGEKRSRVAGRARRPVEPRWLSRLLGTSRPTCLQPANEKMPWTVDLRSLPLNHVDLVPLSGPESQEENDAHDAEIRNHADPCVCNRLVEHFD